MEPQLPYGGEWYKSPQPKFAETVVLVHFYAGSKKSLRRHIDLLTEIGFNCVAFDLYDDFQDIPRSLPGILKSDFKKADIRFGLKHVWTEQIEHILNLISGKKILFAFSNPGGSAIEAVAKRGAQDISSLVLDSGPSGNLFKSLISYYKHETPIPTLPLRIAAAFATTLVWHPMYKNVIHQDLAKFPEGFRVLSIRGWKDHLVTPKSIDSLFEPHPQIDWQRLSLPEAGHLNGLKDFPAEYIPALTSFLENTASRL